MICGVDAEGCEQQRHGARHNWKTRTVKRVKRMHRVPRFRTSEGQDWAKSTVLMYQRVQSRGAIIYPLKFGEFFCPRPRIAPVKDLSGAVVTRLLSHNKFKFDPWILPVVAHAHSLMDGQHVEYRGDAHSLSILS